MRDCSLRVIAFPLFLLLAASNHAAPVGDSVTGKRKAAPCVSCHAETGNSLAAVFPKLAGQTAEYLVRELLKIQSGAREVPEMAGQLNELNERDFFDIAAWYASQEMSPGVAQKDLIALGQRIYRGGLRDKEVTACGACHSATGLGNDVGGIPHLAGQHAEYIAKRLDFYRKEICLSDDDTCIMPNVASRMSDAEIEAVSSYIAGLRQR